MTGEMNRRITLNRPAATTQDEGGGIVVGVLSSYNIWAKVETRNGSIITGQNQQQWQYDYKITFRYERSRPVASNSTIDYDSKKIADKFNLI